MASGLSQRLLLVLAVATVGLGVSAIAFFKDGERTRIYHEEMRATLERDLRSHLSHGDATEKVERVLKDMDLSSQYDTFNHAFVARRAIGKSSWLAVSAYVVLNDGVERLSKIEVKIQHNSL